jgi:hypothetical protein
MFRKFGYGDVGVSNHVHLAEYGFRDCSPPTLSILAVDGTSFILNSIFCILSPNELSAWH